jgi:hypothetical protein
MQRSKDTGQRKIQKGKEKKVISDVVIVIHLVHATHHPIYVVVHAQDHLLSDLDTFLGLLRGQVPKRVRKAIQEDVIFLVVPVSLPIGHWVRRMKSWKAMFRYCSVVECQSAQYMYV